jgi:hypothetical protein
VFMVRDMLGGRKMNSATQELCERASYLIEEAGLNNRRVEAVIGGDYRTALVANTRTYALVFDRMKAITDASEKVRLGKKLRDISTATGELRQMIFEDSEKRKGR